MSGSRRTRRCEGDRRVYIARVSIRWSLALSCLLVACGAAPDRIAPTPVEKSAPVPLTPEQNKALAAAERLYRANDEAYPAARDELAKDPVTALWLTRMVARDAVVAFDRRQASDGDFLRQAVGTDPVWDRALVEIEALGATAVPCLITDLLRHPRHDRRRLGVTLLARTGADSIPAMRTELEGPDDALRRLTVLAVGEMPAGEGPLGALRAAAKDPEFTVRSAACEGLARMGTAGFADLRAALTAESDPFVRRVAARGLGGDRTRITAEALLTYMRACAVAGDRDGVAAAHEAMSRLADRDPRRPRGVEAWAVWTAEQSVVWE